MSTLKKKGTSSESSYFSQVEETKVDLGKLKELDEQELNKYENETITNPVVSLSENCEEISAVNAETAIGSLDAEVIANVVAPWDKEGSNLNSEAVLKSEATKEASDERNKHSATEDSECTKL